MKERLIEVFSAKQTYYKLQTITAGDPQKYQKQLLDQYLAFLDSIFEEIRAWCHKKFLTEFTPGPILDLTKV
jgi:hypothetical protein